MQWIHDHLHALGKRHAFVCTDRIYTYALLQQAVQVWRFDLQRRQIPPGASVAVIGDYAPDVTALMLALIGNGNIVVPLTRETSPQHERFFALADVRHRFDFGDGMPRYAAVPGSGSHPLLERLRDEGEGGLVLFTSGSTGQSKGAVLKVSALLQKYRDLAPEQQRPLRTAAFLKLDHIGGINTLFATLFHGGAAIPMTDRSVEAVCAAVQQHRVELLPTTPTFINMLLFSQAHRTFDLGSLKVITYGTEPMPPSTLRAANEALPGVRFKQTYGSTELGIFATRSESSSSTWLQISPRDAAMKVHNGSLWIRSGSAMLGYLNAPHPFDEDGWYDTGDQVEVRGDYLRILGRKSEIINVGGEKVFPAEVESVLLEMGNVRDALVWSKHSPLTGHIVAATLSLNSPEHRASLQQRVYEHCAGRLQHYKIPRFVMAADKELIGNRLKKLRNPL
jgi:acyl-CoA synthetase (AMP-forming)/AMP-acid ligase II